jgi:hypothetical protein
MNPSLATASIGPAPRDLVAPALSPDSEDDQRLRELAAILATGILRLHARAALPTPEKPENPRPNCLEVRAETVPSVPHGFTVPRLRETRSEPCD